MSRVLREDSMEALITARTAAGSCMSYNDDDSSVGTWTNHSMTRSCSSSPFKTSACSTLPQSSSYYSGLGSLTSSGGTPSRGQKSLMNDQDKRIYNSLGSTSSPIGKQTYSELGLRRGWKKRGVMWKTGPNPNWLTPWKKRYFVLKGNFLYYFACQRNMDTAPVLGAIYLKHAVIKKEHIGLSKTVLKICPSVPRRKGYVESNAESSNFYIKFRSITGRDDWYEELQQVSFENSFPVEKRPIINSSMEYTNTGQNLLSVY